MDQIRPEIRTFVLGTTGLSTATWNVAFNLGAYRTIFYGHIFAVWVTVTAILLVVLLVPERDVPVPWWGKLLMLVPTVGVALVPINSINNEGEVTKWLVIGLGLFAILVCLPVESRNILTFERRHNGPEFLKGERRNGERRISISRTINRISGHRFETG